MLVSSKDLIPFHYFFPVFGGIFDSDNKFSPKEIFGTAFYINDNYFITCAHTIESAASIGTLATAYMNDKGDLLFQRINETELFNDLDLGIFRSNTPAKPFPWIINKLKMISKILSIGYPYGFDNVNAEVNLRAFMGHISLLGFYNRFPSKPAYYELSYQCPRGLSGAPLLHSINNNLFISGFTIGNEITDMVVSSIREENKENGAISLYEKTESLHRGIAIASEPILNLRSKLLGNSILEHLKKHNLLHIAH